MVAQKMIVEVTGFGVLTKKKSRSGISEKSGKPWEMYSVDFAYLGGMLDVQVEKDQFDQLSENTEYQLTGRLIQQGYDQKLVDPKFVMYSGK